MKTSERETGRDRTCPSCVFYHEVGERYYAVCRRMPPQNRVEGMPRDVTGFPPIAPDHVACGEYVHRRDMP